jgi:hypothetical protein
MRSVLGKSFFLQLFFLVLLWGQVGAEPLTHVDNKHRLGYRALYNGVMAQDPTALNGTDRICIFCHTPHASTPDSTLWNRPAPQKASFPLYGDTSGATLVIKGDFGGSANTESQYGVGVYPNGASRMCMSCHDGVTAIGLLADNSTIAMLVGVANKLDGDGSFNDAIAAVIDLDTAHPISFIYDETVRASIEVVRGVGTYQLPGGSGVDVPLDGQDRMQCTTCHDPHNDTNLDGLGLPFWRHTGTVIVNRYDDVCNACHLAPATNFVPGSFVPGTPTGTHNLP